MGEVAGVAHDAVAVVVEVAAASRLISVVHTVCIRVGRLVIRRVVGVRVGRSVLGGRSLSRHVEGLLRGHHIHLAFVDLDHARLHAHLHLIRGLLHCILHTLY